jgi:hypothetical protein
LRWVINNPPPFSENHDKSPSLEVFFINKSTGLLKACLTNIRLNGILIVYKIAHLGKNTYPKIGINT